MSPVAGVLSSSYGTRRSYNGGPPESPHQGTDFAVDMGTQVVAANAGIVVFAGVWQVRGNAIVIDHGIGVYSGAYHLSELLVEEGQEVAKGEIIGRVGASGMATGPHLHWDYGGARNAHLAGRLDGVRSTTSSRYGRWYRELTARC